MVNKDNLYSTILNSSNIGLIVLDKDYNITEVNPFILESTSFKQEELLNKSIDFLICRCDINDSFTNIIKSKIKNNEPLNITHQIKSEDNSYFWIEISGSLYDDHSIWTICKIENRNIKEKAIKEILFSIYKKDDVSFMDSITLQLSKTLDADHTFIGEIQNNKFAVKTISHCMDKKIVDGFEYNLSNTPCELVHDGKSAIFPQNIKALFPKDQDLKDLNIEGYAGIPLFNEKGETLGLIVALYRTPIKNPEFVESTISLFASIVANEYERQKAEKLVKEQDLKLLEQSKMAAMGEMLEAIAHQWRQPLSTITTASTGTKFQKEIGTLDDESFYEAMELINNSAQHLSQTIDDFRSFYKVSKNRYTQFNISNTIDKALNLISAQFDTHEIEIIQNIEDIEIKSSENDLIQVLMNIFNNARDELINHKDARLLFINIYKKDSCLYIEIKDNAKGIPKDIMNKIFEMHFTTKEDSNGTGIGLYMSRDIVNKLLNGSLDAENETFTYKNKEYTGAKFTIKLKLNV